MSKRLVIDLDGTLCHQTNYEGYSRAVPFTDRIRHTNLLYLSGWHVTIHTARGMNTHKGNVAEIEKNLRSVTESWLSANGVLYNDLVFGKPPADIYVDDKASYIEHYMNGSVLNREVASRIVFTNGCFDILHKGHIEVLKYCHKRAAGGLVVVGLNSDASIKRLKGNNRPIQDQETRKAVLESLKYVDSVVIFDEDTPLNIIKIIDPSIIVKSEEYLGQDVVGSELGKTVEYSPWIDGYSTTASVKKIGGCSCLSGCKSWDCDKS